MVSWRGTTASLILCPSSHPAVPTSCSDLATHRHSRETKRRRSTARFSATFRLLETDCSRPETKGLRKTDHLRVTALRRAGLAIRASHLETRHLATLTAPTTLPPTRPLSVSRSDQHPPRAPFREKDRQSRRQTRHEVRTGGRSRLMGCLRTLHTAYRIRRHLTIRPSDHTCIYIPSSAFCF